MPKELDELRESYYKTIIMLQDLEDIDSILPQPQYQSFFPLMNGIITKLNEEKKELESLNSTDPEVVAEIELITKKITHCTSRVQQVNDELHSESLEEQAKHPRRHLIFATTTYNNTYLQKDLGDIPAEYYDKILSIIDDLENGEITNNTQKFRQLSNNKKLENLFEAKAFKIRLVYRVLESNVLFIMSVRMKKDDNSLIDTRDLAARKNATAQEYDLLKKKFKDPTLKELIIEENEQKKQEIKNFLEQRKRSDKNGQLL